MIRFVLLFIPLFFLLAGCWDIEESDRMNYVHGLGIDYKNNQVTVYLQIVYLGSIGNPNVSPDTQEQVTIATASAESINQAIFKIYQSTQRRIYWGHETFILMSENALENNLLNETLDLINRYPETRYRIRMFSTKDDIKGLLKVSTLFAGSPLLTRLTDLDNTYEQSSRIHDVSIRQLLIHLHEPGHNGLLPTVELAEQTWETEKEPKPMIKATGVASVTPNQFKGFINGKDIDGLRWMQKNTNRSNLSIEEDGKPVSEAVVIKPKATYNISVQGEKVIFHTTVKAKAIINEMMQAVNQAELIKKIEQTMKKEIMHTYEKALEIDTDIYRLSEILYRRDLQTWKKLEKKGRIKLTEASLRVETEVQLIESKLNKTKPVVD